MSTRAVPPVFVDPATLGRQRPGPRPPGSDAAELQRIKLVSAFMHVAAEKGYAATTLADISSRAQVSLRTFYEHFADKQACLSAAYEMTSVLIFDLVTAEIARLELEPWPRRLVAGLTAFVRGILYSPDIARMFFLEHLGAGPDALRHDRAIKQMWVDYLREQVAREAAPGSPFHAIADLPSDAVGMGLVGSIFELSLLVLETDREYGEPEFVRDATALFCAICFRSVHLFAPFVLEAGSGVEAGMPAAELLERANQLLGSLEVPPLS